MAIAQYPCDIVHVQGKDNVIADALSRTPFVLIKFYWAPTIFFKCSVSFGSHPIRQRELQLQEATFWCFFASYLHLVPHYGEGIRTCLTSQIQNLARDKPGGGGRRWESTPRAWGWCPSVYICAPDVHREPSLDQARPFLGVWLSTLPS